MSDEDKAHSLWAPSGAEPRMLCPGKLAMEKGLPDISSVYADEGTAAHTVASWSLLNGVNPHNYIGTVLKVQGSKHSQIREFMCDEDMADYLQAYVSAVRHCAKSAVYWAVEQRVYFGEFIDQPDSESFGTGDCIILSPIGNGEYELQPHDLKYGVGVKVFAEKNRQLFHYALGAYAAFRRFYNITRVRMVIHQPRLNWVDEYPCDVSEMLAFATESAKNAKLAKWLVEQKSVMSQQDFMQYLNPGEKQCMFCKAQAMCPAVKTKIDNLLQKYITNLDAPPATLVDPHALGSAMDSIEFVENWCKSIRAQVERELIAGKPPIGKDGPYKLVRGRRGRRYFTDKEAVANHCAVNGWTERDIYDFQLKSPKQMEGACTKRKSLLRSADLWKDLQQYIHQPNGPVSVAPASDPRQAVTVNNVDELLSKHFTNLEDCNG